MTTRNWQNLLVIPLLIFFLLAPLLTPFAEAFNFPDRYDLVAVLVEQGLYEDTEDYDGLSETTNGPGISKTNIKQRVDRYAIDVQNSLPGTRAVIIQVDRFEEPKNVSAVLERLYFDGDPKEPTRVAYLRGIAIIGEVPLPVVNKNGTRFISLFPYTDFEKRAYEWNESSQDFVLGENVQNPQPEIWHGVIRPPASTQTPDGKELLAAYLDKNHLYHVGDPAYTTFDKRAFFQDFLAQRKNMSASAFKNYLNFLEHQDDVAYVRYTRELYEELAGPLQAEMAEDQAETAALQAELEASGIPFDDEVPRPTPPPGTPVQPAGGGQGGAGGGPGQTAQVSDILTKVGQMSDKLMPRFFQIFSKYPALINDLMNGTGRFLHYELEVEMKTGRKFKVPIEQQDEWENRPDVEKVTVIKIYDVDSAVNLITLKDQHTLTYLKAVNTMVERKIDEVVNRLQKNVLIADSRIDIEKVRVKIPGLDDIELPSGTPLTETHAADFVNFSPAFTNDGTNFPNLLNGLELSEVTSAAACTPYRGSKGTGDLSKSVTLNRAFNDLTAADFDVDAEAKTGRSLQEKSADYACWNGLYNGNCQGYEHFAGCFFDGSRLVEGPSANAQTCFPERATDPVFVSDGTKEVAGLPPVNFDNFLSCQNFYEKGQYVEYLKSVDERLESLDDELPRNAQSPEQVRAELERRARAKPLKAKERHPDDVVIFSAGLPATPPLPALSFEVTLGHILRGMGWNAAANPEGWRAFWRETILNATPSSVRTVNIAHDNVKNVQIKFSRPVERSISSVIYHKEPTAETLSAQAAALVTKDLPVDNPRYVTFQNQQGGVSRITYPNIFEAETYADFEEALAEVERQLNAFPRPAVAGQAPCQNCLKNLVSALPEAATFPEGQDILVARAHAPAVADAMAWRDMDIDAKHIYVVDAYLNASRSAFTSETPNGYELLYFNGEGTASQYEFSMNADLPEEDDAGFAEAGKAAASQNDEAPDVAPAETGNRFYSAPPDTAGQAGYDLFSWSPPPVSPWWERMQEWAASLEETTKQFQFGKSEEEFYGELNKENTERKGSISKETSQFEGQLALGGDAEFSRIASFSLRADSLVACASCDTRLNSVVAAGKKVPLRLELKDKDGKLVNDEFTRVTLAVEGEATFSDETSDEDPAAPGLQLTMFSGVKEIALMTPETESVTKISAQIDGRPELSSEFTLTGIEGAALKMETETSAVVANGTSAVKVRLTVVDTKGNRLDMPNSPVRLNLADPAMGRLPEQGPGEEFTFIAGVKSGPAIITATSPVLEPGSLSVNLLPGSPKRMALSASPETLLAEPGGSAQLAATLLDEHGNVVSTNSAVTVKFRLTEKTSGFAAIPAPEVRVSEGLAQATLLPREETGTVNIVAEAMGADATRISPAMLTVKSVRRYGAGNVANMNVSSLAAALLGIPAGDVTDHTALGLAFLASGKVQALTTLTTPPAPYQKLFEVGERGGLRINNPSRIVASFLPGNHLTFVLHDTEARLPVAEFSVVALREGQFDVTNETSPQNLSDGIYIRNIATDPAYRVDLSKGSLRVLKDDSERLEIQTNGFLQIFDPAFTVRPKNAERLILEVLDRESVVAEIYLIQHFNQDVQIGPLRGDVPGVYVTPRKLPPHLKIEAALTGDSSQSPKGAVFFDTRNVVSGLQAPGFEFQSLEDAGNRIGVGFTEDNKFTLLFAGGEMFGEANRSYASDAGIVLGDPTVRIEGRGSWPHAPHEGISPELEVEGSFTKDIGKLISAGGDEVRGLLPLDYDDDGHEDLLIVRGEGEIELLQNNGGLDQLKNQGTLFNIKNGIQDLTKVDVNKDGQMDLVIAAQESCRKGETCLDIYENHGGAFVRRNLTFDQQEKIMTVRAEDLNLDSFPELILADTAGDIKILYNRDGVIDVNPQLVGNVGLSVDPAKNLIQSVLIHYPGISTRNPEDPASVQMYQQIPLPAGERDFLYADLDTAAFANSTKFAQDLNGGVVKTGDRIRYTITLKNGSAAPRSSLSVSDVFSDQLELDTASFQCINCAPGELRVSTIPGDPSRSHLFENIRVPARGERTIQYEMVFRGGTDSGEKIVMMMSPEFQDADGQVQAALTGDNFPDISVTKEGNPTGRVRYFASRGIDGLGRLVWESMLSSPPEPPSQEAYNARTGLNTPNQDEINNFPVSCRLPSGEDVEAPNSAACQELGGEPGAPLGVPPVASDALGDLTGGDSDGDGIPNSIDDLNGGLDDLANATSAAVSKLTCDAGCIALPLNYAFFAPGLINVLGVPGGFDPGLPVFGWGAPSLIPTWPPMPHPTTTGGRFYISPAITGGVGFSVCVGPYLTPQNCFSFGISPLDLLPGNLCDKLSGVTGGALAVANGAIREAGGGLTLSIGGGSGPAGIGGGRRSSGSGLGNYSLGAYEAPVSRSRNIRVPGFPAVITDWFARQMEEFADKALSLPDIYLIYPSGKSLIGAFDPQQNFESINTGNVLTNVLTWLNSIPLIDIETEEVTLKIPIMTRKEIEKFKADARQWVEDVRLELDRWRSIMGCVDAVAGTDLSGRKSRNEELCQFVTLEMNTFINSVTANMKALDLWILFPKKILQFRAIESYYLGQIVGYLDTVIEATAGWTQRNIARVKQWRRAIRTMRQVIEQWKALAEVMIDYNEFCDKCTTDRFSLKELILKLFAAIPAPPVIPLPKLPDIILDVSKIQAGVKIQWPDVRFTPTPFTLPKLPRIRLGVDLTIPQFKLLVPGLPVIPPPPELPTLPSLPQISLPTLPDFPPPPTMPGLPGQLEALISVLKKLVKIICIIKLGFMPTDEFLLKTRIEEITARPLSPVLPIDLMFTIETPLISSLYVDQIIVTAMTNLKLDLSYVQEQVSKLVDKANKFSTDLTKGVNSFTDNLSKQIEKVTSPTINIPGTEGRLNYEETLKRIVEDLYAEEKERAKILAQIPESFTLEVQNVPYVAKQTAHQPRRVANNESLPFVQRMTEYRNQLAATIQSTENSLARLSLEDEFEAYHALVNASRPQFLTKNLKRYVAGIATGDADVALPAAHATVNVGSFDPSTVLWAPEDAEDAEDAEANRLIALTQPPELPLDATQASQDAPGFRDVGIFYNGQRLINYTLEASATSHLADIDVDNDGDRDKIYSYGRNVYAKENLTRTPREIRPTFRPVDVEIWTIFELLPKDSAPLSPESISETSQEANFTFKKSELAGGSFVGFEVIAKKSPHFFEEPGLEDSIRLHLVPDPIAAKQDGNNALALIDPDGKVTVNQDAITQYSAVRGDYIETGENSSVTLKTSDGMGLRLSEETGFTIPAGSDLRLLKGYMEIDLPMTGSALLPPGTRLSVEESGEIRLRFFDGSEVRVTRARPFTLPEVRPVLASLSSVFGTATFTGAKREFVSSRDGIVHVAPGEVMHPLGVSRIMWNAGQDSAQELLLSQDIMLPVPASQGLGMDIEVDEGVVEILRSELGTQPIAAGMALTFGDQVHVQTGEVSVQYLRGGETDIRFNETYVLERLEDPGNPSASLKLPEGFYFGRIASFNQEGERGTFSEKFLMAPQVCGDTTVPFANFGKTEFEVAIGKMLSLDASRSFDSDGPIVSYTLDTDAEKDADGDGVPWNDKDVGGSPRFGLHSPELGSESPAFTLGPYTDVSTKKMRLTVRDGAFNPGYQDITVSVITPRIVLEPSPLQSSVISGYVVPPEANVPITIARLRGGAGSPGWEMFKTETANEHGQYFTNADGKFVIQDADMRDRLVVRNREGVVVAEINTQTGAIQITDDRYETRVLLPETSPNTSSLPLRVGIFLKSDPPPGTRASRATRLNSGIPLTFVYFIPDVNTDTVIDDFDTEYTAQAALLMSGVHVKPLPKAAEENLSFRILPGNDALVPGATVMERIDVPGEAPARLAVIDVNGSIELRRDAELGEFGATISDPKFTLRVKPTTSPAGNDPVVFELLSQGEPVAEIFIAVSRSATESIEILEAATAPGRPRPTVQKTAKPVFTDVPLTSSFSETATRLYERGIIAGYPSDARGQLLFKPEQNINRAEFTQITLKMLCILPRDEAKVLPSPFYDVLQPKSWFYPVLKEGNIRGFIKGYLGESRTNPATGRQETPFKPANNITWAEATTVTLAALQEQNVIDMSSADFRSVPGVPWYEKYLIVAQDLKPYLRDPDNAFITYLLTSQEASHPNLPITRGEFAMLAERVLLFRDCYDLDRDGLLDDFERKYGDPEKIGPDDIPPDTPETPPDAATKLKDEEGSYVLRPACGNVCPCQATLGPGGDLQSGDLIFAAITGQGGVPIYAKSNEESY